MPTHEEHLAGIEEATGRVRTLKARFNSVENDWCEAAKQLQRVHDIRQKWIDEHGSAPSDPVIQPLLQSSQKLYIRKAREYLAVSREMTALITQRDMQMSMGRMRNVNGRRTESACGSNGLLELKPRTVKGEKKLIAKDEKKKKKKKKLSVGNKKKKKLSVKDKRKLSVKDKRKLSVKDKKKLSAKNKLEPKPGHARDEMQSSGKRELVKSRPGVKHTPDKKKRPEESASKPNRTHESDSASKLSRKPGSGRNPSLIASNPLSTTPPPLQPPTEPSPPHKQPSNGEPAS
ncbi:hypothetical protein KC354_g9064 [Hortaea werneckii]|nr:hypothetical protein KC354_g9064 [Hortaea werneckii]